MVATFIWSGRERFLGPDECLKMGLVDEILEPALLHEAHPSYRRDARPRRARAREPLLSSCHNLAVERPSPQGLRIGPPGHRRSARSPGLHMRI